MARPVLRRVSAVNRALIVVSVGEERVVPTGALVIPEGALINIGGQMVATKFSEATHLSFWEPPGVLGWLFRKEERSWEPQLLSREIVNLL